MERSVFMVAPAGRLLSEMAGWDAVPTGDDRDVDGTEPAASTAPIHWPRL